MTDRVVINTRDFTAAVPDGPVNRHAGLTLSFDPDTGQVFAEAALEQAREGARDVRGNLPAEQLAGGEHTEATDLDRLRDELREARAENERLRTPGTAGTTDGGAV